MTTPYFFCEAEGSCRVKLASTKGKTRGCSGMDAEFSDLTCVWGGCELVDDVEEEVVVDVRGLVDGVVAWSVDFEIFLIQSFRSVERST